MHHQHKHWREHNLLPDVTILRLQLTIYIFTTWSQVCGHLYWTVCACWIFYFKIMGINRELAFCKSFQFSGKADTRASVRSGMMDSSSWFIPNLFNGSDSVNHFFMDLALCTGACHTDRKGPYFTVNVCLRKLYGCMLDFMHMLVKGVSKTDKSSN